MKIALDPTPFHHDFELLEFPRVVAELGYEYLQLTPHRDFTRGTTSDCRTTGAPTSTAASRRPGEVRRRRNRPS